MPPHSPCPTRPSAAYIEQETQSDAEAFSEGFKRLGLGPLVGMRTWGGQIWCRNGGWQQDGGAVQLPETGAYSGDEWLIEGRGVEPDVEVDNLSWATFHGADAQV